MNRRHLFFPAVLLALGLGCGDGGGGSGEIQVLLDAEETITEGLDPGTEGESIVDGWTVRFDKYLVAIGALEIQSASLGADLEAEEVVVVDLTQLPASGFTLATFREVEAGQYDFFGYETPVATAEATAGPGVIAADLDEMVAEGWTYLIEGTLTKADGESCPPPERACVPATSITFRIGAPADTFFGPCEPEEGLEGFSVAGEGVTAVAATIHGDHLFFDAFPEGAEIVERRAQWLADADVDGSGSVDSAELKGIAAETLFTSDRYSLSGSPVPIEDALDFVVAQLKTQGHFQGEGECAFDGMAHEHDE